MAGATILRNFLEDSIVRGFILTTILLLGLCLEQSLLNQPFSQKIASFFLIGNLIGYPIAVCLWRYFYHNYRLPLYSWLLEAFFVVSFSLKPLPFIAFIIGVIFSLLLLHLFLLTYNSLDFDIIITKVAVGIGIGNLLLLGIEYIPYPLGIGWLGVALAGWRIKRPSTQIISPFDKPRVNKRYFIFLMFLFLFYTVGGLYYELLKGLNGKDLDLLNEYSYILYIVGLAASVPLARFQKRLIPFISITIMGSALLFMMPPSKISPYSIGVMDLSFGMMDAYSIAYIFSTANGLEQVSFGLGIFPFSILINMMILNHLSPAFDIRWGLGFLFLTLLPLSLFTRSSVNVKRKKTKVLSPLALPAPESNTLEGCGSERLCKKIEYGELNCNSQDWEIEPHLEVIAQVLNLTCREREVFELLVKDKKLKDIAKELDLAIGTIKALSSRIYEKAGVKGRKELIQRMDLE